MSWQSQYALIQKVVGGGIEGLQPSVQDRVYSAEGCATAITTAYMPKILEQGNETVYMGKQR